MVSEMIGSSYLFLLSFARFAVQKRVSIRPSMPQRPIDATKTLDAKNAHVFATRGLVPVMLILLMFGYHAVSTFKRAMSGNQ